MKHSKSPAQLAKQKQVERILANKIAKSKTHPHDNEKLAAFVLKFSGTIVLPGDPNYDQDRKDFNDVYPAYPQIIAYVANYDDVRWCVQYAQQNQMAACVRSGGHSLASYSVCDGMIIDLSQLTSIHVDPQSNTVFVEAGVTFGNLNPALEFYNLHLPGGGCDTVAVAGFMQAGGYGITARTFGINSDCVLEVTVMLADGSIVVANSSQNQDLFWAVRGGTGGNFGVLLNIQYQLFPLDFIWGIRITWDIDEDTPNAAQALYTIQEQYLSGSQYPNLGIETVLCTDIEKTGHKIILFCASFTGTEQDLDAAIAPLLAVPGATVVLRMQDRYSAVNAALFANVPDVPQDAKAYSRSSYIGRLLSVAEWTDILTQFKNTAPNKYTTVDMECYGGVINEYPVENSAFIHRSVTMNFFCDAFFTPETNDQKKNEDWLNWFFQYMEANYANGESYQNYPNRDQTDFRWAYWTVYYNQLVSIKEKYNPGNFLEFQQSIGGAMTSHEDQKQIMLFTPTEIQYEKY
jgi:hypothetical protein